MRGLPVRAGGNQHPTTQLAVPLQRPSSMQCDVCISVSSLPREAVIRAQHASLLLLLPRLLSHSLTLTLARLLVCCAIVLPYLLPAPPLSEAAAADTAAAFGRGAGGDCDCDCGGGCGGGGTAQPKDAAAR